MLGKHKHVQALEQTNSDGIFKFRPFRRTSQQPNYLLIFCVILFSNKFFANLLLHNSVPSTAFILYSRVLVDVCFEK